VKRLQQSTQTFIFVDEADTQFGDVQDDSGGGTEKRLTGKIQAMMSDVRLKGRVIWFLMTARIHRLSPDIRRPGRMDLIIPVLDPEGKDRNDFVSWAFNSVNPQAGEVLHTAEVHKAVEGYSAATFAALRSRIKSKGCNTIQEALEIAGDILQPDIEETRRYQTLQALMNCTRKSLLFDANKTPDEIKTERKKWKEELIELERKGVN